MLDFEAVDTWPCQVDGRMDGQDAVEKGEGFYFDKLREWHTSATLKVEFPTLHDYLVSFRAYNKQRII
jgi:hypothetical protein